MAAHSVLRQELIWRVGNGSDIKAWGDRWIPSPVTYMVQSLRVLLDEDAQVANLIDQDTKTWNGDLIATIFHEDEAKVIKGIPLSPLQLWDRLIWRCTPIGVFLVRSAYHMEMEKATCMYE